MGIAIPIVECLVGIPTTMAVAVNKNTYGLVPHNNGLMELSMAYLRGYPLENLRAYPMAYPRGYPLAYPLLYPTV